MVKLIKDSEKQFRELAELLPQSVYEIDLHGTFTFINHRGLDALGYTVKDVQEGLNVSDTVISEDRGRLHVCIKRVLSGETISSNEYTVRSRNGSTFTVVTCGLPIRRRNRIVGIRGVAVDITKLKAARKELERATEKLEVRFKEKALQLELAHQELWEAEAKYGALAGSLPAITYVTEMDDENTVVYLSSQAETFLGVPAAAGMVAADFWGKHLHPEDRDRVPAGRSRRRARGERFVSEYRMVGRDDRIVWFRDEAQVIRDKQGTPLYIQGVMLDITERKRSERQLRESKELFEAIFQISGDYIFIKDASLKYTHVNPAMSNLFNTSAGSIIGKSDRGLFGEDAAVRMREVDNSVLTGTVIEEEHTQSVGGVPTTFQVTKVPMRDHSGNVIGLCGIARDVTERTRAPSTGPKTEAPYHSQAMKVTLTEAFQAAQTDSTVLLTGESGSGKDYMAKYIHDHSRRAGGPFFSVNCAAVAPELAESELFGHEPGAFTGARGRKRGLLELAGGGTLLLNEVGELSLGLQAKLLTFLDTKSLTKVGGEKNITIDARLIAATNRDLGQEVTEGRFRADLFYRLNVLAIHIPPLRDRKNDLPVLVQQIVSKLAEDMQLQYVPEVEPRLMERLRSYSWPGNIRELRNVLERALILSREGPLQPESAELGDDSTIEQLSVRDTSCGETLNTVVARVKRGLVIDALKRNAGNRSKAARDLGISRYSVIHYIKSLGINDDDV